MVAKLKLKMGLTRVSAPLYPSEPGFVNAVNEQLKMLADEVQSICDQFEEVSPDIMLEALRPTFQKSQRYCPVKSGELKDSGYLEVTSSSKNPRVEMGYAKGGNPRYAVYVHEILDYAHAPPTRAKWLQAALMEDLDQILLRLGSGYAEFAAFYGTPSPGGYYG
jgi:hypothetical protein